MSNNATQTPPKQPPKIARARGDSEFLPAALEILETPPSPVRMWLILTICALVVTALAWSIIGRMNIVAIAQGKLQPAGRVNVVQPLETGKVRTINVQNGSRVREGDVLIEMDPADAQADVNGQQALLWALEAEIARRRAAAQTIFQRAPAAPSAIAWPDALPADIRQREQRVLDSDMRQLRSVIESLEAQRAQKQAERARVTGTVQSLEKFIEVLDERVRMRQTLVERNAGARANVIDALERLREQQTALAQQSGQLKEVEANLQVIAKEIEKNFQSAASDNTQRLAAVERQRDDTAQRLARAKARLGNMQLRAPNSGLVQALSVINPTQVLSAGEQVMRVVPEGVELEVEVYVLNKDIGFIKEGQEAVIKVESFPFTKYGTIGARVVRIARDAIPQPDASQIEANPAQATRSSGLGGAQRTQNLVFQVILKPEKETIGIEGETVKLLPGMAVSAEIKTGSRRMIEFVFAPLVTVGSQSMRER
ncbi:MAG: HlyD family type I secretion periplasmic adaptor subunit [Alphaproteobacteria bacterium]|nr:HlyD family type I secretion periplasmic adaptor subunit [Alphaproteobacteria bacterium]